MRKHLHSWKAYALALAVSFVSFGMMAETLKPYPVYFSLGDYPEFKALKGWRNPDAHNSSVSSDNITSITWLTDLGEGKEHSNCASIGYRLTADAIQSYPAVTAYGDYVTLACSYNRAMHIWFQTPWLNPGKYRIYINAFSAQTGANAYRGCAIASVQMDGDTLTTVPDWVVNADGQRTIGGVTAGAGIAFNNGNFTDSLIALNGYKDPVVTNLGLHTNTGFYLGQCEIAAAGIHTLGITINGKDGVDVGYEMISFIPVTDTDANADYEYPKFDIGGNAYIDAAYPWTSYTGANHVYSMESLDSSLIIDAVGESMGVLPFQVTDPSSYDNMKKVKLNCGKFFTGKYVVLLREADNWTRMATAVVDSEGYAEVSVPAGNYYCEVDGTNYYGSLLEVTEDKEFWVGTETGVIVPKFNASEWFIDNTFRIYSTEGKLYYDLKIKEDGTLSHIELPMGSYYFRVGESDDKTTYFQEYSFDVTSSEALTLDFTEPEYNVTVNAGTDEWVIGKDFQIYAYSSNTALNAVYCDAQLSSTGTYSIKLPAGTYVFQLDNNFLNYTFEVSQDVTLDNTGRYNAEIYLGNIMNGYSIDAYKFYYVDYNSDMMDTTLLVGTATVANGKAVISGLSNGTYRFNVYKGETVVNPFTAFTIDGANVVVGDPEKLDGAYIVPKAVFFDPLQTPGINWRTDASATWTNTGSDDDGLPEMVLPVMPVNYYKTDTTWITDSTYETSTDSSVITKTIYRAGLTYTWSGTATEAKSSYVNGDYAAFLMNSTNCPDGVTLSFQTPIILPGRYNLYLGNRGNGDKFKPMLDTIFVDGKPTSLQQVSMCFYTPMDAASTDETRLNAHPTPYRRSVAQSTSSSIGNILDVYLGWIDIETAGRHTVTLKSRKAGCYYVATEAPAYDQYTCTPYFEQKGENEYWVYNTATNPFWVDLFKFIPVGEDVTPNLGLYYPTFDICGYPAYVATSSGNNDLGTEGVNHIFAPWQQPENSVWQNENADYTSKISLVSGQYGAADQLSLTDAVDNWTHYEFNADSTTGNFASLPVIPSVYNWQTLNEGIVGTQTIDLNQEYTLTIPETLPSKTTGTYNFTPSEDDPEIGTVSLVANVALGGDYPFTYPVTGPVTFTEFDGLIATDTLYAASEGQLIYELPDYPVSDLTGEVGQFKVIYSGNGGRLLASTEETPMVHVQALAQAANISVYPNPVVEVLNINANGAKAAFQIYTQNGQLVTKGSFAGETQVNFRGTAAGMYFLKVNAEGKQATYKLLVK